MATFPERIIQIKTEKKLMQKAIRAVKQTNRDMVRFINMTKQAD